MSGTSGTSGVSGDHEASVDLDVSEVPSVSGSAEAEVPEIILVPDTDKGQYMN